MDDQDSVVWVHIQANEMRATIDILPPRGKGARLELQQLIDILHSSGVVYGIDVPRIEATLEELGRSGQKLEGIVVAAGKEPVARKDETLVLEVSPEPSRPALEVTHSVDFREIPAFRIVESGQVVARVSPAREEEPGINVLGERIEPPRAGGAAGGAYTLGQNLERRGGEIVASVAGRFVAEKGSIGVQEGLSIPGDVDYGTGNVNFPGHVRVKGVVKRGFKLTVGGDLMLDTGTEVDQVLCNGDLIAKEGLIGGPDSKVLVGGTLEAGFLQNVYIESLRGIKVRKNTVLSKLYSSGGMAFQRGAILVNSELVSRDDVVLWDVGNERSPACSITCGIDYIAERKLAKYTAQSHDLRGRSRAGAIRSTDDRARFEEEEAELTSRIIECLERLDGGGEAQIVVNGSIAAGTRLRINGLQIKTERPMRAVRFLLDKKAGRIVCRSAAEYAEKEA